MWPPILQAATSDEKLEKALRWAEQAEKENVKLREFFRTCTPKKKPKGQTSSPVSTEKVLKRLFGDGEAAHEGDKKGSEGGSEGGEGAGEAVKEKRKGLSHEVLENADRQAERMAS